LNKLTPFEYGGSMVDEVNNEITTFKDLPERLEAGTPAIAEVIGLKVALEYLMNLGFDQIHQHELKLKKYFLKLVTAIPELEIYNINSPNGIITFNIKDVHPHDMASIFDNLNVCVRAGHHCNQLTMKHLKVSSTLRATIYIYNDESDIDRLVEGIKKGITFFKV